MTKSSRYQELFKRKAGVKLDVGCGINKQKGFIGMDMFKHKGVDIVHDIQKFPWPVPKDSCFQVLLSHVWEHVEPKYRFQLMDELWRICRHDGQLLISCPHAGSMFEAAHPAHYMCPNEVTFTFFDPDYHMWHACSYKKPLPWKITALRPNLAGNIEVILEPRKTKKGKPLMQTTAKVKDYVKVQIRDKDEKKAEAEQAERLSNHYEKRKSRKPQTENPCSNSIPWYCEDGMGAR